MPRHRRTQIPILHMPWHPKFHLAEKKHLCLYMSTDAITHLKLFFAIYFSRSDFPLCYIAARKRTIFSSLSIVHAFCANHILPSHQKRDLDYGCDAYQPCLPVCPRMPRVVGRWPTLSVREIWSSFCPIFTSRNTFGISYSGQCTAISCRLI